MGQQNATVADCPVNHYQEKEQFIVAVHNPRTKEHDGLIRILLPTRNYRAQLFSQESGGFEDVNSDMIEQRHFNQNGTLYSDFEMVI